jgi:hypothetical protein
MIERTITAGNKPGPLSEEEKKGIEPKCSLRAGLTKLNSEISGFSA